MSTTQTIAVLAGAAIPMSLGSALAADAQSYTSADEVRAIVADMMADAETRSSLLQTGGAAGYDEGFFIRGGGGEFELRVNGLVQFRYVMNFLDDNNTDADFESGFDATRTELSFSGHAGAENIFYRIQGDFGDRGGDGTFNLEDAFLGYRFDNGWHLKFGQFKLGYMRSEMISDGHLLAADRSVTNEYFSQGRSQGVELGYMGEDYRVMLAFSDGFRSSNTEIGQNKGVGFITDPITNDVLGTTGYLNNGGEADLAFTARGEYKFAGTWDQFADFTSPQGSEYAALLGVAGHIEYTDGDRFNQGGGGGEATYYGFTVDLSLEGDGWNFFIAGMTSFEDLQDLPDNTVAPIDTIDSESDDYGVVAQGGVFIPETDWELFARYDAIFFDDSERDLDEDTFQTVTFGANWYWDAHAAKFTIDVQWFLDEGNALIGSSDVTNYVAQAADADDQFAIRAQFQLLF